MTQQSHQQSGHSSTHIASPDGHLTRRHFLQALGAVGGVGLMMSGMSAFGIGIASVQDRPPTLSGTANGKRVVILGAGLAGLVSAYELRKQGYQCEILETRAFAGGRCQTARYGFVLPQLGQDDEVCQFDDGQYYNHGPWRIPYHHRSTLHYTREFGIPLEIFVNYNEAAFVTGPNAKALGAGPIRQMEVLADMRGHASEILAKHVDQSALDVPLTQEEKEKFLEFLVHEGHLDKRGLDYLGTGGRGYQKNPGAGLHSGQASEPYALNQLLNSGLYDIVSSVSGFSQQKTMFQPIGGMDKIAEGFEEQIGDLVRYQAKVSKIQQSDDGVMIDYVDGGSGETHQIQGDYCICTIPVSVLKNIDADFGDEFVAAMNSLSYEPTCKLGLQMKTRFWEVEDHIYGGHSLTHNSETGNISYPSTGWQAQKGIVQGVYNFGSKAAQFSAMDRNARIDKALGVGEQLHAGYRRDFENGFNTAWHLEPDSLGGWAHWSAEGRRTAYPLLNEPQGRILLAGEHLSYLTGWQAGAIESAWIQIEKLHDMAMAS
ncbi:flavin monoamine oxidase family protein [Halomonas elongata]|uniref:flavin monoamine oxidase family protein n=1 Tax=Halomonas elongata TaxID=2746 RepID=UPI0023AFE63E|nr:flavin monoamine oxidase family protein [Halomonas elongata]